MDEGAVDKDERAGANDDEEGNISALPFRNGATSPRLVVAASSSIACRGGGFAIGAMGGAVTSNATPASAGSTSSQAWSWRA